MAGAGLLTTATRAAGHGLRALQLPSVRNLARLAVRQGGFSPTPALHRYPIHRFDIRTVSTVALPQANTLIENAIGVKDSVATLTTLRINAKQVTLPLILCPSYDAAVFAAPQLDVLASATPSIMMGQVLFHPERGKEEAFMTQCASLHDQIFELAQSIFPNLYKRGGGLQKAYSIRLTEGMVKFQFDMDVQHAMGANMINIGAEEIARFIKEKTGCDYTIRILSNDGKHRTGSAETQIALSELPISRSELEARIAQLSDESVALKINTEIARLGDGAVVASGNDNRAWLASLHLMAAESPSGYRSLARFSIKGDFLNVWTTVPAMIGTVGRVNEMQFSRELLEKMGKPSPQDIAKVLGALSLQGALEGLLNMDCGQLSPSEKPTRYEISPRPLVTVPTKTKDLSIEARVKLIADLMDIPLSFFDIFLPETSETDPAPHHTLPLGMAFPVINGKVFPVVLKVEEPSIIAAMMRSITKLMPEGVTATAERSGNSIIVRISGQLRPENVKGGVDMLKKIEGGYLFALLDAQRRVTNNKGVLNAIVPILMALGSDYVKAAMHLQHAAGDTPFFQWTVKEGVLHCSGELVFPDDVFTSPAPTTQTDAVETLMGHLSPEEKAMACAVAGALANGAAIQGLCTDGMKKHRELHNQPLKS